MQPQTTEEARQMAKECIHDFALVDTNGVKWLDCIINYQLPDYRYSTNRLEVMRSVLAHGPKANQYDYVTNAGGRVFPVRRCGDDDKRRVMDDSARTAVCARRLRSGRGMGCGELHQRDRNRGGLPFTLSGFTDFGAIHPSSWPERTFGWLSGCEVKNSDPCGSRAASCESPAARSL